MKYRVRMDLIDPDASQDSALQALSWCVEMGHTDLLQPLLNTHFVDFRLSDAPTHCEQILTNAVQNKRTTMFKQILKHVDTNHLLHSDGTTKCLASKLLCLATRKGLPDLTEILLDSQADINTVYDGKPLLNLALFCGDQKILLLLINKGADPNQMDNKGDTPLLAAMKSQFLKDKAEIVTSLINHGADPKLRSMSLKDPIHIAAAHSAPCIQALVDSGCDVNSQDGVNKDCPLHIACNRCNSECIDILIKCGANINVINGRGETPLEHLLKFATKQHDFHAQQRIELARKLLRLGFRAQQKTKTDNMKHRRGRNKVREVYDELLKTVEVSSLQNLCRPVIRDKLPGIGFMKTVNKLDIPEHLKLYLAFGSA